MKVDVLRLRWDGQPTRLNRQPAVWRWVSPGPGYAYHWEKFAISDPEEKAEFEHDAREARSIKAELDAAERRRKKERGNQPEGPVVSVSDGMSRWEATHEGKGLERRG